ncbi:hypothetical protein DAPPUDRAFT_327777 [Daphnia pulex]|uniref:Uncharacterized protein n=1 Tax=Daphnia pulex TaxID=6669 RepID=E9HBR1_DAPPU|nr:hypothetical protein DAPPUDRAFT_327777 [Daphnia pulex]|eukprot:EFX70828.1 hypothetical protein DAPPUDRAFT_327777 [Daphnia pulex]
MLNGLSPAEAKALREIFNPTYEGSFTLQCPILDESMGRTLKRLKGSSGSVIDFVEKTWLSTHYKIMDIARPLIQLWSSLPPNDPHLQHVESALRLWGVAFRDVTMNRRKNILRQTAPDFLNLLSDPTMFSNREMSRLFGVHFLNAIAKEADGENKIAKVGRNVGHPQTSKRPFNKFARNGGAITPKSSAGPSSGSHRGTGGNPQRASGEKSATLAGWVVSGLDDTRAKSTREAFRPKLKKNADLLINPNLDEAFYIRLKTVKSSSAAKANIDPIEKIYRNQTFKILDLVKPIMFLASRIKKKKKSRADAKAVKTALKLWAVVYHDITSARRRNILTQIYPQNIGLLDDKSILPTGGEHLFGPKFTQALVEQVKTLNALNTAGAPRASGSNDGHGQRQSGRSFSNPPASSGGRYSNFNGSLYVQTILAFQESFGGRIARFAFEWSKLTLDPWILSTVSQGLQLDFISDPVQFSIPPNACMDTHQYDCCKQEANSLIEKGAIVRARDQVLTDCPSGGFAKSVARLSVRWLRQQLIQALTARFNAGCTEPAQARAEKFCEKFKLEILLGIHSPTAVRKSWHFDGYG